MDPGVLDLLRQGLAITVVGMSLVFGALALLWGLIALLGRIFGPETREAGERAQTGAAPASEPAADPLRAAQTLERSRVAAIVASALISDAMSVHLEPPPGPTFEHGRTAPAWVTTNRARVMRPWQPPRSAQE